MDSSKANEKVLEIIQENKDVWKTQAEFFSWIRGGIRQGIWMRHPVKLKLLNKLRKQIPNPNPKGKKATVWGATCDLCNQDHVISNIQVDHREGGDYSLKNIEDVDLFFKNVILVTESDLRLLCKECNATCTYAKRFGLTYEEAFCTKFVIKLAKEKTLYKFFEDRNLPKPKNQTIAKEEALAILLKEVK